MELSEDSERKISEQTQAVKAAADAERRKAVETRQKAMETMGESRKRLAEEKGEERKREEREVTLLRDLERRQKWMRMLRSEK